MTLEQMFIEAQSDWYEVLPGMCLISAKRIAEFQQEWSDGDEAKDWDFSTAPYWLQVDTEPPAPIYNSSDLEEYIDIWETQ